MKSYQKVVVRIIALARNNKRSFFSGILLFANLSTANADIVSLSMTENTGLLATGNTFSTASVSWSGSNSFSLFDSTLGNLNSVTISVSGSSSGNRFPVSYNPSNSTVTSTISAEQTISFGVNGLPGSISLIIQDTDTKSTSQTRPFFPNFGGQFIGKPLPIIDSNYVFTGADALQFIGLGMFDIGYNMDASVSANAGVRISSSFISDFTSVVDYEYTSTVPVPTAVWLFGSGLLGLIGVARRKKH